jgi:hypothetical protein
MAVSSSVDACESLLASIGSQPPASTALRIPARRAASAPTIRTVSRTEFRTGSPGIPLDDGAALALTDRPSTGQAAALREGTTAPT